MKFPLFLIFFASFSAALKESNGQQRRIDSLPLPTLKEITLFVCRVRDLDRNEPVTGRDIEMFSHFGLAILVQMLCPESLLGERVAALLEDNEENTWENIFDVCQNVEPSFPILTLFELLSKLKNINSLSRKEFISFYRLLNFLRGDCDSSENMQWILGNVDQSLSTQRISNSELEMIVCSVSLSPRSIHIDFSKSSKLFERSDFSVLLARLLDDYLSQLKLSPHSINSLQSISISHCPSNEDYELFLFEILRLASRSLISLKIVESFQKGFLDMLVDLIRFDNLSQVSVDSCSILILKNLRFLNHSNYTVLDLPNSISRDENNYFNCFWDYPCDSLLMLELIQRNGNLQMLRLDFDYSFEEFECEFKVAIRELAELKYFDFFPLGDIKDYFGKDSKIERLAVSNVFEVCDWKSLESLNFLRHLKIVSCLEFGNSFFDFLSHSRLESLEVKQRLFDEREYPLLFGALNQIKNFQTLALDMYFYEKVPGPAVGPAFEGVYLEYVAPVTNSNSYWNNLPSGPNVKFLWIGNYINDPCNFTVIKAKFPKLEFLFIDLAASECEEIEIRPFKCEDSLSLMKSVSLVSFGYVDNKF